MDETRIRETLSSNLGQVLSAIEKKAIKEYSGTGEEGPFELTEKNITDAFAKKASETVFAGIKQNDRTYKILRVILKKKYLATCMTQRFERIKEDTDKKEEKLYADYAQRSARYIELITKMLENRTLEANTGHDSKLAEYKKLEASRKKLEKELQTLEKRIVLEDALKESKKLGEIADQQMDQGYT